MELFFRYLSTESFLYCGLSGLINFHCMLKKLFEHKTAIVFSLVFVLLLVAVRIYENELFYDPFLLYFKSDFKDAPLPVFNYFKLFIGFLFRYSLNMVVSLGLIYTLFKDITMIKFATLLYLFFFLVLILYCFVILHFFGEENKLAFFYVRRFLVQPIFVLLFIPAFYYQKQYN
ncbi:exosortase F system-associated protein [Flavobacterium sp. 7E]|uniref:exosortase F system-associated membrane protein n=1 Tax=Flavobacterium sp. 7E TaxID=2735898 RepID=UPI00352DA072